MGRKKTLRVRSKIQETPRAGAKQPAIEPQEVLLMMETLSRWVLFDHRHKTYLSKELIWIAARLLELRSKDDTHWEMSKTWPLIAFAMGIDTKTFRVLDEKRFKWFWYQLGQTGRFNIKWQTDLINSGKEPPEIEPLIVTKANPPPKVKQQKLHAEQVKEYQDNSRKDDIMDHFFV